MVRHYSRLPALLVLVVATSIGAVYLKRSGKANGSGAASGKATLVELEKLIADGKDEADIWFAYGLRLEDATPPRFANAAIAFRKALEKKPENRDAKINCALALAQAGEGSANDFYNFLRDLLYVEPKLVVELFDRPECQAHLAQSRFATLRKEARAQAMD